jgi:hypothetical protein
MHRCPFCKPSRAMPERKGDNGRIWSSDDIEPLVAAPLVAAKHPEMALMGIAEFCGPETSDEFPR